VLLTIAEIIATRKPAILIPYPSAAENHQFFNAKMVVKSWWWMVF
jgi:UDP-N-acetylglucosamine:LPS N-acetylglucosamine transferase